METSSKSRGYVALAGPGGVATEQMYLPGTAMAHGDRAIRGPNLSWQVSVAPVMMRA